MLTPLVAPGGEMFLHCYDSHPRSRLQARSRLLEGQGSRPYFFIAASIRPTGMA